MAGRFDIRISHDARDLLRRLDEAGRQKFPRAAAAALNKVAATVRTVAKRDIARQTGLRSGVVLAGLAIERAGPDRLLAAVVATGRPVPLIGFAARQTRAGVTAHAWGGRKLYPGAFIATMPTGHVGVFRRLGDRRGAPRPAKGGKTPGRIIRPELPIKQLWGPSIPGGLRDAAVQAALRATVAERLPLELTRALRRFGLA